MSRRHSRTVEALVLRSFDVGEADRFCILFTKEEGRIPVRAAGARKTGSKLGAILLPLRHVTVDIAEHGSGIAARSASIVGLTPVRDATELAVTQEAVELLLRLTDDHQDLPDVFEHCRRFLEHPLPPRALPAFTARLLYLLGILPLTDEDVRFAALSAEERAQLCTCTREAPWLQGTYGRGPQALLTLLLHEHLRSPLVTSQVRAALA